MGFLIFLAVVVIILTAVVARGMRTVPQGYQRSNASGVIALP